MSIFESEEAMSAAESLFEEMQPATQEGGSRRTDLGHFELLLDESTSPGS